MVCPAQVIPVWWLTWIKNLGHFQHFSYTFWALDCNNSKWNIHSPLRSLIKRLWVIDNRKITNAARYKSDHLKKKKKGISFWMHLDPSWHMKGRVKGKLGRSGRRRSELEFTARKKGRGEWKKRDLWFAAFRRDAFLPLHTLTLFPPLHGPGTGKMVWKLWLACHVFPPAPYFSCS